MRIAPLSAVWLLAACATSHAPVAAPPTTAEPIATAPPSTPPPAPPSSTPPAPPAPTTGGGDLVASLLAQVHTAASCSPTSTPSPFCLAADGWATGEPAPFFDGPHVYLGLVVELQSGESVADALHTKVGLSALAIKSDGASLTARISTLGAPPGPGNDAQATMLASALQAIAPVFTGQSQTALIDKELTDYLISLVAKADQPATHLGQGYVFGSTTKAELRQVGEYWVAIERPETGPDGIWLSVFTDYFQAK